jgi:hypothetical protein
VVLALEAPHVLLFIVGIVGSLLQHFGTKCLVVTHI